MLPLTVTTTPISSMRTVELDTKHSELSSSKSSWESITAGTETSTGLMYSTTVQSATGGKSTKQSTHKPLQTTNDGDNGEQTRIYRIYKYIHLSSNKTSVSSFCKREYYTIVIHYFLKFEHDNVNLTVLPKIQQTAQTLQNLACACCD